MTQLASDTLMMEGGGQSWMEKLQVILIQGVGR